MAVSGAVLLIGLLGCAGERDRSPWAKDCEQRMAAVGFKSGTDLGKAEIKNCERVRDAEAEKNSVVATNALSKPDATVTQPAPAPTTTAAATADSGVAASRVGKLPYRYHFTISQAGGYRFSGTLAFGDPAVASDVAVTDGQQTLTASQGCAADDVDAVVPAAVTTRNDTSSFAGKAAFFIHGFSSNGVDGLTVQPSFLLNQGAICQDPATPGEGTGFTTGDIRPGQRQTTLLLFYVKQFYSPDHPDGDVSGLADSPLSFGSSGNDFELTRISGPEPTKNGYLGSLVPLV